jgi:hypothetical protein
MYYPSNSKSRTKLSVFESKCILNYSSHGGTGKPTLGSICGMAQLIRISKTIARTRGIFNDAPLDRVAGVTSPAFVTRETQTSFPPSGPRLRIQHIATQFTHDASLEVLLHLPIRAITRIRLIRIVRRGWQLFVRTSLQPDINSDSLRQKVQLWTMLGPPLWYNPLTVDIHAAKTKG